MATDVQSPPERILDPDLKKLRDQLRGEDNVEKKLALVKEYKTTKKFLNEHPKVDSFIEKHHLNEQVIFYSLLAIGQGPHLLKVPGQIQLLEDLLPLEEFYRGIGGIVGYHTTCLELLCQKGVREKKGNYYPPLAEDISKKTTGIKKAIFLGIRHLDELAEMYPLGGAADRLSLRDEETGNFQTAATLEFCGKTLLERLIEDVQAREYLHYKLFGKQVETPIVMMTSHEKKNDARVRKMFKEKNWFGRHKENFFLFSQPRVPAMNKEGKWCVCDSHRLCLKPGGHGVIWKMALEQGALDWLKKKGKKKALMRQINNVIAGIDDGLLAFLGKGFETDKLFGFASCPRAKGLSEGVNVVIENDQKCCLTNIEYCDVEHFLIEQEKPYLANTNLLFVDLSTIPALLEKNSIPGMLVNAKKMKSPDGKGDFIEEEVLRLESTMQNLADGLIETQDPQMPLQNSFITSNERRKTISTIKKEFALGSSMLQTPEQCFLDLLENGRDLLENACGFTVPAMQKATRFFENGASFIFHYHPSLGPIYEIIAQKLKKGRLAMGSELRLDISELYMENLDLDGSLRIATDAILGRFDEDGVIRYSQQVGKCLLKNVRVRNSGIHREASRSFWKEEIIHKEKCEIFIEEGGEFHAEGVCLRGDLRIRVPSGVKVTASMNAGRLELAQEVLKKPSWSWKYSVDSDYSIKLIQQKSE